MKVCLTNFPGPQLVLCYGESVRHMVRIFRFSMFFNIEIKVLLL